MNWYSILQSIITWLLTSFAVSCVAWAAKTSKRITKLEEHDLVQTSQLNKLDDVIKNQVQMMTKLDLIVDGKLQLGGKNED